jgi:hypothetical protein
MHIVATRKFRPYRRILGVPLTKAKAPAWVSTEAIKPGDVIAVWWKPGRDTVIAVRPYEGPLACFKGGKILTFARIEMTAGPGQMYSAFVVADQGARD